MILADKIMNERKKNGWSQEELAEQLNVSRQSVSKWEGAQAIPDLQKIIAMAELFGVSTDYLLKDEIEPEENGVVTREESISATPVRRVSMEEANDYIHIIKERGPRIANGVSLCILSPVLLILLCGLSEEARFGISEAAATIIGIVALLLMVAYAVFSFIMNGTVLGNYEFLEKEEIETAYGVSGMVEEKKNAMADRYTASIAAGVVMCIISPVPLLIVSCLKVPDYVCIAGVCFLFIIVAVAVNIFIRSGMEWGCYQKLLQEGDYERKNKGSNKMVERIGSIYWSLATALYLAVSFITMRWEITWIIWPVAGVLFGAVATITKVIAKQD